MRVKDNFLHRLCSNISTGLSLVNGTLSAQKNGQRNHRPQDLEVILEFVKPLTVQKGETEALDMKGGATDYTTFPGQSEANSSIIFNGMGDADYHQYSGYVWELLR